MGIRVRRLSPSTGEWRLWGGSQVEVHGIPAGVAIEFTRKVGRGRTTFQVELDHESFGELIEVMKAGSNDRATP